MSLIQTLFRGAVHAPGYTFMRGAARFATVRHLVARGRAVLQRGSLAAHLVRHEQAMGASVFTGVDHRSFVAELRQQGVAFGLRLPSDMVNEILAYSRRAECYADRERDKGFPPAQRAAAEAALGKPILVAQYLNVESACPVLSRLREDPFIQWVAGAYLGSVPTHVGTNLWWTFPVQASAEDRDRHAHLFHRDVDDFRFFKFFFYLTDVSPGDGGHVCVVGSQHRIPVRRWADRWLIRRYSDEEVARTYAESAIREISGPAGIGFAEDTLCIHKGKTPVREPRLLLQLQFALFDYGTMHDRVPPDQLAQIA